ncbi:MAG: ABC transporter substrate-binding protein [Firmicutes bacterium]|nr:ABC transporter substrate-binding protein [Bacillota bacterium]
MKQQRCWEIETIVKSGFFKNPLWRWIAAGLIIIGFITYLSLLTGLFRKTGDRRQPQAGREYLRIVDSYRRVVTLDQTPARVVSAAPNITEIIFALGKEEILVGRTDYCDYPAEACRIESIGDIMAPNLEKIVALNPDLVIASTHFQKEVVAKLEDLGIKIAILDVEKSFDGVYQLIGQVGQVLGVDEKAAELVSDMKRKVAEITEKVKDLPKPKVYYILFYGDGGFFTAGQDTFIGNMLQMAGGDNAAADSKGWQYSIEKLVEKDPDLLICSKFYQTKEIILETPGFKDLKAVKAGRILEIDHNLLDRQGPRLTEGLGTLAGMLHPEVFTDYQRKRSTP